MFSPEMMKMASEMMAKMTPEQMAQMQSMASNMSPEMVAQQQAMMQNLSPAEMQRAQAQMAGMNPASISQQAQGLETYQYNGALQLKNEGNQLHVAKNYSEAAEKYQRARSNIAGHTSAQANDLRRACTLNLSSCYLNLGRHEDCIRECSAVLEEEARNRKALYRRGQAYAALGDYRSAVPDLEVAVELSPPEEKAVLQEKLQEAREKLPSQAAPSRAAEASRNHAAGGTVVEEVSDSAASAYTVQEPASAAEEAESASLSAQSPPPGADAAPPLPPQPAAHAEGGLPAGSWPSASGAAEAGAFRGGGGEAARLRATAQMLRNPAYITQMESMMAGMTQEQLDMMAAASGAPPGVRLTPEQARQQLEALKNSDPEEVERMARYAEANPGFTPDGSQVKAAAQMMKDDPVAVQRAVDMMASMPQEQLDAIARASGAPMGLQVTPEMARLAAQQMQALPPEQLEQLAAQASSLRSQGPGGPTPAAPPAENLSRSTASPPATSSSTTTPTPLPPAPAPSTAAAPTQNPQMAQAASMMQDPAMMEQVSRMMADMPPEQMEAMARASGAPPCNMSGQQGMQFSPEMMKMASEMMRTMSPEDIARMSTMAQQMHGGGGSAAAGAAAGGAAPTPGAVPDAARMMADMQASPEMMETAMRMMKGLDPATMAAMARQNGLNMSEEQAAKLKAGMDKLTPGQMAFMVKAAGFVQRMMQGARRAKELILAHRMLALSIAMLLLALLLRRWGWI